MKKLALMFVMLVGFGACDTQIQDDVPVERVAPLVSDGDGAEPSPGPNANRPDPSVRWKCSNGGAICINRYSLETVVDSYCEGYHKPECSHAVR